MEQSVDKIAALAIAAQGNLPVQVDKNASIAIVPDGFKVHSTEKFNAHRDRFRGTFNTNNIDSFVDYAKARGIEGLKTSSIQITTFAPKHFSTLVMTPSLVMQMTLQA